ncbi:MAG TPA: 1,4-alpha-glucan branching protein GlgB, partial [Candidatus Acidoferrum sp.]|nr:1,4-alpha-glucan branching protein GlgB [Candidatus Acidoferrum sp.]
LPGGYRLIVKYPGGISATVHDPYNFPPMLSDFDLHLIGEGTHYQKYEKLGAHLRAVNGVQGVQFGVWAPNALRVSVVGDFNHWDGRVHPMRARGSTGLWEIFLSGLEEGMIYKFEIRSRLSDLPFLKADPYGFSAELRPKTGSVVCDINRYAWHDDDWMADRATRNWLEAPISVYEVHLGSWRHARSEAGRFPTCREIADELIPYVKEMGYTHVELLPVMEHPYDASWGYQTVGYFAATSRYGGPADLMELIDRFHQAGIGVILDWTPAHFPRDAHGLAQFDGSHLYEHEDPRRGAHPDWGTLVFNYGRVEVQNFLIANALFWLEKYHFDGLRVDAVASMLYLDYSRKAGEWVPNEYGGNENLAAVAFLKRLNEVIHGRHAGVLTIAEESTSWPGVSRPTYLGGLGFSLKWNMGWMNDTLKYFKLDPVHRKFHHNQITFSMIYAFSENFVLPFSHDEVVHGKASLLGKMPGDDWQKLANLRTLYGYLYAHPGKKLLFMGSELGQWSEWNHDRSLDWGLLGHASHRGLAQLVADLNHLYTAEPALHQVDFDWHGFEWMDCHDSDHGVLSFVRRAKDPGDFLLVVANLTPVVRENYRVPVPAPGFYREVLNTDAAAYGGTNVGNLGGVPADPMAWGDHPHSLKLTLPPLAALFLKPTRA